MQLEGLQLAGSFAMAVIVGMHVTYRVRLDLEGSRASATALAWLVAGIVIVRISTAQLELFDAVTARILNGYLAAAIMAGLLTWEMRRPRLWAR